MKTRLISIFCVICLSATPVFAISDSGIRDDIAEKLETAQLGKHDIEVSVRRQVVELTGTVSRPEDRFTIERFVLDTDGVMEVRNKILVTESSSAPLQSGRLVDAALAKIRSSQGMHDWNITVTAQDSHLTLAGTVNRPEDRQTIERLVSEIAGVDTITNEIRTALPMSDEAVTGRVRQALMDTPEVDLSKIQIRTTDGVVLFSGSLNNHREIDRVLSVAQMVDGVRAVRSEMRIGTLAYGDVIKKY